MNRSTDTANTEVAGFFRCPVQTDQGQAIIRIGGQNTSEEISALRRAVEEHGWNRVGLVTSSWHMPRAMRNARRHGVQAIPIPADFWSDGPPGPWQLALIPSADAMATTHRALLEFVGMAVGR